MRYLAALLIVLFVAGCGDLTDPGGELLAGDGEIQVLLRRAENSQVPAAAESALVWVSHPDYQYNALKVIEIPDVNDTTRVKFIVEPDQDYRATVIAFQSLHNIRAALAGGVTVGIDASEGAATRVQIHVEPWEWDLILEDSLVGGKTYPIEAQLQQGSEELLGVWGFVYGIDPWEWPVLHVTDSVSTFVGWAFDSLHVPRVEEDTTLWIGLVARLKLGGDYGAEWHHLWPGEIGDHVYGGRPLVFYPYPGDPLWTRPVRCGGATIWIEVNEVGN